MIRFAIGRRGNQSASRLIRFIEQEEEFDPLDQAFSIEGRMNSLQFSTQEDESETENDEDENSGAVDGDSAYITITSPPAEAEIVEVPSHHGRFYTVGMQCIYYPDRKYALCGYSDQDPAILDRGPYHSREAAAEVLLTEYGYGTIPGFWEQLFGELGNFSKAYTFAARYRWQAWISGSGDEYYITSDGPESDPLYALFFHGGHKAVQHWHDEY